MKIKIAVVDSDELYLSRLVSSFNDFYTNDVELFTFSEIAIAEKTLSGRMVDVFLLSERFDGGNIFADLPFQSKANAYLVESKDIDEIKGFKAICKYQKTELIHKSIIGLLADNDKGTVYTESAASDGASHIYTVTSAAGGTGASSIAAGFAAFLARTGKRTLYLSLEKVSSSDVFFHGEGSYGFSDVIYALVSKKSNLNVKLRTYVKSDSSGVYFFSGCKCAIDMSEMNDENIMTLVSSVASSGDYDSIVIDMPFSYSKAAMNVYSRSHAVVFVTDGGLCSDIKTCMAYEGIMAADGTKNTGISGKTVMVYNKYVQGVVSSAEKMMEVKGAVPLFAGSEKTADIVNRISNMAIWRNIV